MAARRSRIRRARRLTVPLPDGRSLGAITWPGEGTPLVLLHGLLDSSEGWAALARTSRRPCVALDLPGFGASDLPTRPSLRAYAEDVEDALDALGVQTFVLVGHSLGGGVATALAERVPDRVRALVLLAPVGFGRVPMAEAVSIPGVRNAVELALPLLLGNRMALGTAYRLLVANGVAATEDVLDRVVDRHGELVPGAREATKAVVRAGTSPHGFRHRRIRFDGPVVAVWGDRDRMVPRRHLAGVAAAFPHVDARVWRDMGHHPQRERPEELAALVEQACRTRRPAATAKAA